MSSIVTTNEDFKMKALFASDRIWTDKRFLYIYNMPSCPGINTDKGICDVIRGWRATYNWLNEHESMANATHNRMLVLQKIVSSVLDYAKYYVRKGNDKNSLFSELEKLDVSRNTSLYGLLCHDNRLTSLDVEKNKKLKIH